MFNLYLTEAAAETATTGNSTMSLIMTLVMYGIFIFALWFILFRPQKKEQKRLAAQIAAMEIGDCVLTTSGFIGIVRVRQQQELPYPYGEERYLPCREAGRGSGIR